MIERLVDIMMLTVVALVFVQVGIFPHSIQPYLIGAGVSHWGFLSLSSW